jgi:hypothetical protein
MGHREVTEEPSGAATEAGEITSLLSPSWCPPRERERGVARALLGGRQHGCRSAGGVLSRVGIGWSGKGAVS